MIIICRALITGFLLFFSLGVFAKATNPYVGVVEGTAGKNAACEHAQEDSSGKAVSREINQGDVLANLNLVDAAEDKSESEGSDGSKRAVK